MIMQAYEGYFENGRFTPIGQPLSIQGRRRVILTVFDEPAQKKQSRIKAWDEFFESVNASDETIPEMFERVSFSRDVDL
jgi:hypothetical protein